MNHSPIVPPTLQTTKPALWGQTARAVALIAGLVALSGGPSNAGPLVFADNFANGTVCGWSNSRVPSTYSESFTLDDGAAWPAPWTPISGTAAVADIQGGRARFRPVPTGYSLARVVAPIATQDVEVRFTVIFADVGPGGTQGVGFYVRQNGGYLQQTMPHGQGYAVFVEDFRGPGIGVWKELDGNEIPLAITFDAALAFQNGVPYRVRFRVSQVDPANTLLQAKVWPAAQAEPTAWQVSFLDNTPQLQNLAGGIALDSWSSLQSPNPITAATFVDDVQVNGLCNPLTGRSAVTAVAETFQFTEGPLWRDDHLLFTDIDADAIWRLDPPASLTLFRAPANRANGLARDPAGALLAAEHASRRISHTDALTGVVTPLVEFYQGLRFNSPNDLAVRADGTVYFTDPDYGLAAPEDRELAFNGLFRRAPDGTLTAEWQGTPGVNQPNGVALALSENVLYVTDSMAGTVHTWDVSGGGSLANPRTFASGLTIPDGLCLDTHGNLYVATWTPPAIEVFTADGARWGSIPIPRAATNCAFGGSGLRTLYVTAQEGLYQVTLPFPGSAP